MNLDRGLDTREAAEILGVAVQTIYNWRHQRRGPAYQKLGRRVVYRLADLKKYLARHHIDPETK